MTSTENLELAQRIKNYANAIGWAIQGDGSIVRITKRYRGDKKCNDWFCECDSQYYGILSQIPVSKSQSSIWGTDGGGIGALSAINTGTFKMNISGVKKGFLKELAKLG